MYNTLTRLNREVKFFDSTRIFLNELIKLTPKINTPRASNPAIAPKYMPINSNTMLECYKQNARGVVKNMHEIFVRDQS
jgi:hypothetical protein